MANSIPSIETKIIKYANNNFKNSYDFVLLASRN